jgi:hypothetical protein
MRDVDAREYLTGGFVKKQELRTNGPRQAVVEGVEELEGYFAGKDGKKKLELVLVFADKTKLPLRNEATRLAMIAGYGSRTSGWVGQTIELYFDPNVPNPKGGEAGGIRIRRPVSMPAPEDEYVSDLEVPAKANGAERPVKVRSRASKKPADRDVDDVPF